MHPAPSIIVFTTLSGLGFGLMAFLVMGLPPVGGFTAFVFYAIAFVLAVSGLLASTLHLGHPERALKAFSQWRSSWLSREGVAAVATLILVGLTGVLAVFGNIRLFTLGFPVAVLSLYTVYATSMIYAQLKTVPRWNDRSTSYLFIFHALAGGALLAGQVSLAAPLLLVLGLLQIYVWLTGDKRFAASGTTLGTATGLGDRGAVRAFEPPHTGTNYLLTEMVHVVGRRHAIKLRIIGLVLMSVVPFAVLALLPFHHALALVAVVSHVGGALVCRWLFFSEAEHVVGLYYGQR